MKYSIIGAGPVGSTIASLLDKSGIQVALANSRGVDAVRPIAAKAGHGVIPSSLDDALLADVIFIGIPFIRFKDVASRLADWTGKIVIDVTHTHRLPPDVLEAEVGSRPSSEVNANRVPGAALVKAFNHLPMKDLASPVPAGGRRVMFVSSDDKTASATVADLARTLGFAAIELGPVAEGGRLIQAPNALVYQNLVRFES